MWAGGSGCGMMWGDTGWAMGPVLSTTLVTGCPACLGQGKRGSLCMGLRGHGLKALSWAGGVA